MKNNTKSWKNIAPIIGIVLGSVAFATLGCFDFFGGSSFDVFVDLSWLGVGNPVSQSSHFHSRSPGFIVNGRFSGTFRSAEASGSVSDGVTNFTPEPADFAQIISAKSGSVIID